jgi:hypothetical protein
MTTYIKTITFGPTSGGLKVSPDKVDPIVNDALEKIQRGAGKILDVKITLVQLTPGNHVSAYLIIYDASQPTA